MNRFWILDFGFWIGGANRRPRIASACAIQNPKSKIQNRRPAFTLLEVILALVILGAALAMLGEITRLASQHAVDARAETQAQELAASVMDQVLAGAIPRENASRQPLDVEDEMPWLYSLTIGASPITGIVPIEVEIEQDVEARLNPVKFRLVRWTPTTLETPESGGGGGGLPGGGQGGMGGMMP